MNLDLMCDGATGISRVTSQTTATVAGTYGSASGSAITTEPDAVSFSVRVQIADKEGSVQFPDGTRSKITKLQITEDEIVGKVRNGLLSSSRVFINRRTGQIATSNGFMGTCKPYTPPPPVF